MGSWAIKSWPHAITTTYGDLCSMALRKTQTRPSISSDSFMLTFLGWETGSKSAYFSVQSMDAFSVYAFSALVDLFAG